MPQKLKEHNFGKLSRSPKYDQYLDGSIWEWTKEELEEFSNGAQTVRSGVYSAAARKNDENPDSETRIKVLTQLTANESLVIQAVEEER